MQFVSARHLFQRNALVQSDQASLVLHRQRQQVSIGDVRRAQDWLPIDGIGVQWVDAIRPELVHGVTQGLLQTGKAINTLVSSKARSFIRLSRRVWRTPCLG